MWCSNTKKLGRCSRCEIISACSYRPLSRKHCCRTWKCSRERKNKTSHTSHFIKRFEYIHAYKIRLTQELMPPDYFKRHTFTEHEQTQLDDDFSKKILLAMLVMCHVCDDNMITVVSMALIGWYGCGRNEPASIQMAMNCQEKLNIDFQPVSESVLFQIKYIKY